MDTSETIDLIAGALAKAQGEISNPTKEAENPHFRSHYADLSAGINAVRNGLSKNGIAFAQATSLDGDVLMLETRLVHSSGQWLSSSFPVCRFPSKPQEVGSAMRWEGESGACASLEFDDCRIDLFAREGTKIEQLERAIKAFSRELEREPVAQAAE